MDPIAKRRLGKTDVTVTQYGFGGAGLGSVFRKVDEGDATHAVQTAYAAGIRYFDTAPLYGYGLSEQRMGRALQAYPRADFTLSTKVGYTLVPRAAGEEKSRSDFADALPFNHIFEFSRDAILRSLENSLRRLGLDHADIVLIHDPDESVSIYPDHDPYEASHFAEVMDGAYPALDELRAQGVIRAIGVGMNQCPMLCDFANAGEFDCFLLAGRYTLLQQDALDTLLPLCAEKQISLLIGAPFQSGILATGAVPGALYNYGKAPADILERVRRIQAVCAEFDVVLPAAALQFPFGHSAVASVMPGASSTAEFSANLAHFEQVIPVEFWRELKSRGLIDARAPVMVSS